MFTITESTLQHIGLAGIIVLGAGIFRFRDTRGRRGKGVVFAGIIFIMFVTAIEHDYSAITWLVHKPNQNEEFERWQEAVERGKELQEQIDRERRSNSTSSD